MWELDAKELVSFQSPLKLLVATLYAEISS
jgi:hypothetical protein